MCSQRGYWARRALKKPRRGFFARRDVRQRALYGLRCPHRAAPLGRGLPSATAALPRSGNDRSASEGRTAVYYRRKGDLDGGASACLTAPPQAAVAFAAVRIPPLAAPRKISYKIKKAAPKTARFHKKTKPQNSACEAASAALSGLAFHQGVPGWRSHASPGGACDRPNRSALCADAAHRFWAARLRPSALHLPLCSGFALLRSFYKTFVFLCTRANGCCLLRPGGYEPLAFGVGELRRTGKYNDTAREFVWCAQLPALFLMVIKECWSVKNDIRNRLGRRSGQMVVKPFPFPDAVSALPYFDRET